MNSEDRFSNRPLPTSTPSRRPLTAKRRWCGNPIRLPLALLTLSLVGVPVRPLAAAAPPRPHPGSQKGAALLVDMAAHPRPVHRLPSDQEIPALSALAEGWSQLAQVTQFVNTTNRGVAARVAIHEAGTGSRVLVLIHGMFSESTNWKYVATALANDYELWLVDLPGCGQSDVPNPDRLGAGGYGPVALADRVLQTLEGRLAARPDVRHFLLAGHSLGGMVALRMFADDTLRQRYGGVLNAVDGLVLFAPCDVMLTQFTPTQQAVRHLNGCKVLLGNLTGILPKVIERATVAGFTEPGLASRELQEQGVRLFSRGKERHIIQAMLRDALTWRVLGEELDWSAVEALEARYRHVRPPCLIVWGECDPTLPLGTGYKLKDQLPDARMVVLARSKHLLQLERPETCATLVREFDEQRRAGRLAAARSVQTPWPDAEDRPLELAADTSSEDFSFDHPAEDANLLGAATGRKAATPRP
ncbi:MAG TPA: alpha/beta hydrolase [Verrucomicrobiota bacterium]|nr:alpha/beta hydrolase [Verrucomicrobiota bacterium]